VAGLRPRQLPHRSRASVAGQGTDVSVGEHLGEQTPYLTTTDAAAYLRYESSSAIRTTTREPRRSASGRESV
jgi:hypothetical protein